MVCLYLNKAVKKRNKREEKQRREGGMKGGREGQ
jgi:hypothetical protein